GVAGHKLLANSRMADAVVASETGDVPTLLQIVADLRALDPGYSKLADAVEEKFIKIRITRQDSKLRIRSPYDPEFRHFCRNQGYQWSPHSKTGQFPNADLPEVVEEAQGIYGVSFILGPDGEIYEEGGQVIRPASQVPPQVTA